MFIDDDGIVNFVHKSLVLKYFPDIETISYLWARDALSFFHQFKGTTELPEVIFLDINMPEIDGWEFIDELNAMGVEVPIYILTSSIDEKDKAKALTIPQIKGYYSKPFKLEKIQEILDKDFIDLKV